MRAKRSDEIKTEGAGIRRSQSEHSVSCRYSSRAARDIKHWPQAKTNYNDLHSPRNWPRPSSSLHGNSGCIAHELAIIDIDIDVRATFHSLDETNQFPPYLLGFVSPSSASLPEILGKLGQRAAASRRFRIVVRKCAWKERRKDERGRLRRDSEIRGIRFERVELAF